MTNSIDPPPSKLTGLSELTLVDVTGGVWSLSTTLKSAYHGAVSVARDAYRGAVNWGTAGVVGVVAAHKAFGPANTLGATWDTVNALHAAFDKTGKLPSWAPFASSY
jgi:hypothetical protein